jgi:hypothetical protein
VKSGLQAAAGGDDDMKRLLTFAFLGPLLSWLIFLAMFSPKLLTGPRFDGGLQFFLIALLVCYVPGVVLHLAMAGIDHLLSPHRWRIAVCAVAGFAAAYVVFYYLSRGGSEADFQHYQFFLGLMGAIPAAVCSWLSGR